MSGINNSVTGIQDDGNLNLHHKLFAWDLEFEGLRLRRDPELGVDRIKPCIAPGQVYFLSNKTKANWNLVLGPDNYRDQDYASGVILSWGVTE